MKEKKDITMCSQRWLNGSDCGSESLVLNIDSAVIEMCYSLNGCWSLFYNYVRNPLKTHSLVVATVVEEAVAYLSAAQTSLLFIK